MSPTPPPSPVAQLNLSPPTTPPPSPLWSTPSRSSPRSPTRSLLRTLPLGLLLLPSATPKLQPPPLFFPLLLQTPIWSRSPTSSSAAAPATGRSRSSPRPINLAQPRSHFSSAMVWGHQPPVFS